ncbi:hypothetical protein NDA01_14165 [Trichocoleus desertorum AS-A10]|uniref:hypothetical protein n=1 Tax=Trichocoleus desertorum TaxID=1481672 RepID=UPI00329A6F33
MAQASSRRRQLINEVQASLPEFPVAALKQLFWLSSGDQGSRTWFWGMAVMAVLLIWHWKLLFALGIGVLILLLTHSLQTGTWQIPWADLRRHLRGTKQRFGLAVVSGAIAALSTYISLVIWSETESFWSATGAILQGFGTLAVLVLFIGHLLEHQDEQPTARFDQLVRDLTHADALKRLIAVHQLTQAVTVPTADRGQRRSVVDYLRLLLSQESEPVVRNAVLQSLQSLEKAHRITQAQLPPASAPVVKYTATRVRRPVATVPLTKVKL